MSAAYLSSITLPMHTNDGESLEHIHGMLQQHLAKTFGGWTRVAAMGGWMDKGTAYVEQVAVYHVAVARDEFSIAMLLDIADMFGRAASQLAVFVTLPNNEARVIDLTGATARELGQ